MTEEFNINIMYDMMPGQYTGDYKEGTAIRHGNGKVQYPDGTMYEGSFAENMFHGEGVLR